jgi:hypothetical protein
MMFLLLVTLISMLLAVIMSVIAWRIAGDERRRSEARVASLAAEIHEGGPAAAPAPLHARAAAADDLELRPSRGVVTSGDLFAVTQPHGGSRWPAVVGAGLFVFASAVALVVVLSGGSTVGARSEQDAAPAAAAAAPAAPALPLELVALGHDREGDQLRVRGVVRNPGTGASVERLTAVVFVFDRNGGFITSSRVLVDPALVPGAESFFVVTVPDAGDVGRYRISFRTDERVVPHVDRRDAMQAKL